MTAAFITICRRGEPEHQALAQRGLDTAKALAFHGREYALVLADANGLSCSFHDAIEQACVEASALIAGRQDAVYIDIAAGARVDIVPEAARST